MRARWLMAAGLSLAAVGCDAIDSGSKSELLPPDSPMSGVAGGTTMAGPIFGGPSQPAPTPPGGSFPNPGGFQPSMVVQPVVRSAVPPPPINGGTLLISNDGTTAVAADPDRDRVTLVDLARQEVHATVALKDGDEPGRAAEDGARRVHVVLRHTGELASIGLDDARVIERRHVCATPQGVAYDTKNDALLVACTSGELVTLPAGGGAATRSVHVDIDLRDVIVTGERLFVTRFKSAELLELAADGSVLTRQTPGAVMTSAPNPMGGTVTSRTMAAEVAWRTVADANGKMQMLHQRAQVEPVILKSVQAAGEDVASDCSDGSSCKASPPVPLPPNLGNGPGAGSPYGGGGPSCASIVQSAVSAIELGASASEVSASAGPMLSATTLAVDAAVSLDGKWMALAVAGNETSLAGPLTPNSLVLPTDTGMLAKPADGCVALGGVGGGSASTVTSGAGQAIAVAFDSMNQVLVQTRDPNRVMIYRAPVASPAVQLDQVIATIELGGEARRDSGHDLFHTDAGAGIACASCHPAGGDDGRTWQFSELGPRRTQLINIGIKDTLPLHWDGDLPTFQALVEEVFERRMGGAVLDPDHVGAMSDWINALHPGVPMRASSDLAVARGQALFESSDVGCTNCHNGAKFTNNQSADVGTSGTFQVPSLLGVAYHEPYIHTGCATTLRQRFDPSCGGTSHGNTKQLSETQLSDLVAYLESI